MRFIESSHCQTAPLYRPEKLAQFGEMAQFGSGLAQFEIIFEIAAHVLIYGPYHMVHDIMFE